MSVMIGFAAKMPSAGAANLMTLLRSVSEGGGGGSDAAAAPLLAGSVSEGCGGASDAAAAPFFAGSAAEAAQRTAARRRAGAIRQRSSGRAAGGAQPRVAVDAQRSPRNCEPTDGIARGATQCSVMALSISPAARRFRGGALRWRRATSSWLDLLRTNRNGARKVQPRTRRAQQRWVRSRRRAGNGSGASGCGDEVALASPPWLGSIKAAPSLRHQARRTCTRAQLGCMTR